MSISVGESGDPGPYHDESENSEGTISGSASSSFFAMLSTVALVSSAFPDLVGEADEETPKRRGSKKFKGTRAD